MKTKINYRAEYGLILRNGNRLLCADGIVRAAELAPVADTWFSIPAAIRVKGVRVKGYATKNDDGEAVFRPFVTETAKAPELQWDSSAQLIGTKQYE